MSGKVNTPPENFEAGIAELEELVVSIEKGELSLEKSMDMFGRAAFLSKWCTQRLEDSEKRIKVLVEDNDGSFHLENFPSE